ncbi:MAG TPA: dihydropteroate synthase-like protein [Methanomicrobia archaeon]|nr:dihydropteroate synthase-like protein [Methanomicrobia archaeon]
MRITLATGRKAEGMVRDALKTAAVPDISCKVLTQDLNIAAFSTPRSLKRALEQQQHATASDLILISGFCTADFSALEAELGTPIRLGPRHAYDIGEALRYLEEIEFSAHVPADQFLTTKRRAAAKQNLEEFERRARAVFSLNGLKIGGGSRMKVCAELVDATLMTAREIQRLTHQYLSSGADILDVGVHIGATTSEVARAVQTVRSFAPHVPVSIDSLDVEHIRTGVENGVDMVLSVNRENIPEIGAAVADHDVAAVVIPDSADPRTANESLLANIAEARAAGITRIIGDPILNAVGYGIADSLYNYYTFRMQDKHTPLFFGVGNVTELMDADSVGINATLAGIASELRADILFAPECSDKARGSVRELRVAAEMMLLARARRSAPKDLGIDLLVLKEKRKGPLTDVHGDQLVAAAPAETWQRDPRGFFRIFLCVLDNASDSPRQICAHHSPSGKRIIGESAGAIMDTILRLELASMPSHIAYLSRELTKAELALRLDRTYEQDEALF